MHPFLLSLLAAAHAGTWQPAAVLQPTFAVSSPPEAPALATNGAGHAVVIWDSTGPVRYAERLQGGGWTRGGSVVPGATGWPAAVAIGVDETTAIAWVTVATELVPAHLDVAVRPPGGTFGAAVEVALGAGVWDVDLGVAGDGSVVLAWGDPLGVEVSTLPPGGTWSAPQLVGPGGSAPDLAVNDAGDAVLAWSQGGGLESSWRPAGGAWEAPTLESGAGAGVGVTLDASGGAAIGWLEAGAMWVATRTAAGGWSAPVQVSGSRAATRGSLAGDEQGDLLAAWQEYGPAGTGQVWASTVEAGGAWTAPSRLSAPGDDAGWPTAAFSGDGTAGAVAWVDNVGSVARSSVGVPGPSWTWTRSPLGNASWGSTVPVSAGGGTVAAAWALQLPSNPNAARIVGRANE